LLQRGRAILRRLYAANRLAPSQQWWLALFDDKLRALDDPQP
jgi:hypothetical protein